MKKSERGMFLIYEDKDKDMFSVRERISLTGNLVDPNCIFFLISTIVFGFVGGLSRFFQKEEDDSNKKRVVWIFIKLIKFIKMVKIKKQGQNWFCGLKSWFSEGGDSFSWRT